MAKLLCICGKIGCGKTYYANRLKEQEHAVILSTDEVTYDLTNNQQGDGYDEFAIRVNLYLRKKAVEIVNAGCTVILDWGFWTKENRKEIKRYGENNGVLVEMHYIDIDDKTWYENIEKRNNEVISGNGGSSFYVNEGLLNKVSSLFEIPEKEEIDILYKPHQ
ncbi:ATP-binding protein [uncultured Ruminococcus sp.]|jgi:predicted kinase|uniref:AAA family ATPase n=1 Tax=uncultured Ruminococcus sp. TaxID=165186 RepID=UPI002803B24D|nr:ATP-binding protein [uncultured Ruminococcus sp.]